jgi:hypothetical protein
MNTSSNPPTHEAAPETSDTPPPAPAAPSTFSWRTLLVAAIVFAIIGGAFLLLRGMPQVAANPRTKPVDVFTQSASSASDQPLTLQWRVVTAGPSPFNSNVWTARLELSATGGNGQYVFWLNNQRLPDASHNQFTVDSSACDIVGQVVGVTSGGQAAAQSLAVHSPLPNCAVP